MQHGRGTWVRNVLWGMGHAASGARGPCKCGLMGMQPLTTQKSYKPCIRETIESSVVRIIRGWDGKIEKERFQIHLSLVLFLPTRN